MPATDATSPPTTHFSSIPDRQGGIASVAPDATRDEVLAPLLTLNAKRADEGRAVGGHE